MRRPAPSRGRKRHNGPHAVPLCPQCLAALPTAGWDKCPGCGTAFRWVPLAAAEEDFKLNLRQQVVSVPGAPAINAPPELPAGIA